MKLSHKVAVMMLLWTLTQVFSWIIILCRSTFFLSIKLPLFSIIVSLNCSAWLQNWDLLQMFWETRLKQMKILTEGYEHKPESVGLPSDPLCSLLSPYRRFRTHSHGLLCAGVHVMFRRVWGRSRDRITWAGYRAGSLIPLCLSHLIHKTG